MNDTKSNTDPQKKYWWLLLIVLPIILALIAILPDLLKKDAPAKKPQATAPSVEMKAEHVEQTTEQGHNISNVQGNVTITTTQPEGDIKTEIVIKLMDVKREFIDLLIANKGELGGSIGKTSILYQTNEQPPRGQRMLLEKNREESFVPAPAGSSKQLRLSMECKNAEYAKHIQRFRDRYFHWKVNEKVSARGVVEVEIISFVGERSKKLIELERTSLEAFLNNSHTSCNSKYGP